MGMCTVVGEQNDQLAEDTLEELDWCLDQLQRMQTHRSVGELATDKVNRPHVILLSLKDLVPTLEILLILIHYS